MIEDMIRMRKNYTNKQYLLRYGFTMNEIRWLEDEGWLKIKI